MEQPRLDGNVMVGMETQLSNGAVLQGRCVASNERSTGLQATNSASRKDSNGARLRGGSSVSNSHNLGSASSGCASPATAFENSDGQLLVAAWRTRREKIQGRGNLQYLHVELIKGIVRQIVVEWDDFFYSRTDSRYGGMIRIFYALVALFNTGHLMMDFDVFFVHFIPVSTGRDSWDRDPDIHTIFTFPSTEEEQVVWLQRGAMIWLAQLVFLLIGVAPRFNAVGNFFWHCMFQHHNRLVYTGADFVLRLLAFFVIFLPLHKYTLWDLLGFRKKQQRISSMDTWPMVCFF